MISSFYKGTTKKFTVEITYDDQSPDISADTVRFIVKKKKGDDISNALINKEADVSSYGSSGKALFNLTKSDTLVTPGKYPYMIDWALASGEYYILEIGEVEILPII